MGFALSRLQYQVEPEVSQRSDIAIDITWRLHFHRNNGDVDVEAAAQRHSRVCLPTCLPTCLVLTYGLIIFFDFATSSYCTCLLWARYSSRFPVLTYLFALLLSPPSSQPTTGSSSKKRGYSPHAISECWLSHSSTPSNQPLPCDCNKCVSDPPLPVIGYTANKPRARKVRRTVATSVAPIRAVISRLWAFILHASQGKASYCATLLLRN